MPAKCLTMSGFLRVQRGEMTPSSAALRQVGRAVLTVDVFGDQAPASTGVQARALDLGQAKQRRRRVHVCSGADRALRAGGAQARVGLCSRRHAPAVSNSSGPPPTGPRSPVLHRPRWEEGAGLSRPVVAHSNGALQQPTYYKQPSQFKKGCRAHGQSHIAAAARAGGSDLLIAGSVKRKSGKEQVEGEMCLSVR